MRLGNSCCESGNTNYRAIYRRINFKSQFNLDPMTGALFAFTNNRKSGIEFIIYVVPLVARNLLLLIYNGDPFKFKFQKNWKEI